MNIYPSGSIIANRYEVVQGPAEKHSLAGGMGLVYLCMDHQENRPIALKTFRPEFLPDRAARDRFLREGATWVDLGRHPNIVRCYNIDHIGHGREVYLALELVSQEQGHRDASLRSWLDQPIPLEQTLLFILQIVRGMKHAHMKIPGFVHRDLKPENILVGRDKIPSLGANRLRVTDFGLANILSISKAQSSFNLGDKTRPRHNLRRTQLTYGIVGTPLYMAPEQWKAGEIGVYTDIYALGCILSEMLTGKQTVFGNDLNSLEQAHCAGQVQVLPSSFPAVIRDLVDNCLQVSSEKRYQDWETSKTHCLEPGRKSMDRNYLQPKSPKS